MPICINCKSILKGASKKYCTNTCEATYKYNAYIKKWKNGDVSGARGVISKNISNHLRRYLFEKYGSKCIICGWSEKHKITGRVPLEVDHLDGNSENNKEENLRLLCPNCHSLSYTFRNLNKGKGRHWRISHKELNLH